jgi:cytochrome b
VLKWFIVLHMAAVLFYWIFKRDNLIRPMITGWKGWSHGPLPQIEVASRWHALLGIALAAGIVWYVT